MSEKLNYVPLPVLDDPNYMTSYLNMLTLSSVFFGKLRTTFRCLIVLTGPRYLCSTRPRNPRPTYVTFSAFSKSNR